MPERIVILPSRLHQFAFCPRQIWLDYWLQAKKPLRQRLRMFLGKIAHWIHHIFRVGYTKERLLEVEIPDLNVKLVGKPDAYRIDVDTVVVEEFKSYSRPKNPNRWGIPVWESDLVQVLAYAFMLSRMHNGKRVLVTVRYIDGSVAFEYSKELETILIQYIQQYKKVVELEIVMPEVKRDRRCNKCVYKEICDRIDSEAG